MLELFIVNDTRSQCGNNDVANTTLHILHASAKLMEGRGTLERDISS